MRWDGGMIPIEQPPPLPPPGWQGEKRDAEHIKLLSIFHYVFAGLSVVGGLVLSQLLTLYTTPVVFVALERLRQRFAPSTAPRAVPLSHASPS